MVILPSRKYRISVAPLAGSVDRNSQVLRLRPAFMVSLPSRGAWIEILKLHKAAAKALVAPLAGSVDRNNTYDAEVCCWLSSLPSRGAWIEMESAPLLPQ